MKQCYKIDKCTQSSNTVKSPSIIAQKTCATLDNSWNS